MFEIVNANEFLYCPREFDNYDWDLTLYTSKTLDKILELSPKLENVYAVFELENGPTCFAMGWKGDGGGGLEPMVETFRYKMHKDSWMKFRDIKEVVRL